jgi:hypothetical protein
MGRIPTTVCDHTSAQLLDGLRESHILHGIPTGVTYEEITGALENCYGDNHLEALFHSQVNKRTQLVLESLLSLSLPSATWFTAPTLNYVNT